VRPFAGFPGYSYLPNPTAAAAPTPGTPAASGPERASTYYDYGAAVHQQQQQQQQQPPAAARPEQTVNNSPLHRHHCDPHATVYRTANTAMQRKQCSAAALLTNQHQQMMLHSELYTAGGEDHGVKAYVTGTSLGCPSYVIIALSILWPVSQDRKLYISPHRICVVTRPSEVHRNGFVSVNSTQASVTLR
jgi:hypothetical protein